MIKWFLWDLQKKAFKHKIWRDYLRLVIKEDDLESVDELIKILENLDNDNSNYQVKWFHDKKLSFFKVKTKAGEAIVWTIVFNDISVPILFFEKYDEHTRNFSKSWWRIDYYGMFNRMLDIWEIEKKYNENYMYWFLEKVNAWKKISRYDWKIDLFYKVNKKIFRPEVITKLRKNSKVDYKVVGGNIQSWRLWARKSKQYLIRWYDKQADTMVKGKFPVYKDYFLEVDPETGEKHNYKNVYRLEFEFLNNFCTKFNYDNIWELESHIEKFLNYDKSIWKIFEGKNNTDIWEIKDRFKYADSTKGYMKWCISNWINIFWLLDDVFSSMWKTQEEIKNIFLDYVKRKWNIDNWTDKREDIDLIEEVHRVFKFYE